MEGLVVLLVIVGIGVLPYVLRRILRNGMNKVGDAVRNQRIDRERKATPPTAESLADRYKE